ncbi:MAG: flagellar assembly protein FliW [Lachnospiraceae bacterium]|nr:flagellar assembly protein FliW [Lachnospiraceae bacterium]
MQVKTKIFGDITVDDEKIITFPAGIVGFTDLKKFALIHDSEKTDGSTLSFLVSMDEPAFAMPVIDPLLVKPDYNPVVEDEILKPIGKLDPDETLCLVTMTVPHEIEKLSVNLMAPIIVNVSTRMAAQVILDDDDCPIKFPVYEILSKAKREAEKSAGKGGN